MSGSTSEMEADNEEIVTDSDVASDISEVYVPGISRPLKAGEELTFDKSAYVMLHRFHTAYPCLSFEPLYKESTHGVEQLSFPFECRLIAGSQADHPKQNSIYVLELNGLERFSVVSDESSSDEDDIDKQDYGYKQKNNGSIFHCVRLPHYGDINRIRTHQLHQTQVCAVWNAQGKVQIWNLNSAIRVLNTMPTEKDAVLDIDEKPIFSFAGHLSEGFAMDWSTVVCGQFASGDCRKNIHLWKPLDAGTWQIEHRPFNKHTSSVEDIQWSKTDPSVFLSCSADRSVKTWDIRVAPKDACILDILDAHDKDVNVINLNPREPLLLTGGDDGAVKLWDFRMLTEHKPVAIFSYHRAPVTSVEWSPHERSVFAASGEDDTVTLWDVTAESENAAGPNQTKLPTQLLFIHMGQKEVKEVHWHRNCEGVLFTTALDCFNVLKTISI